MPVDLPVVRGDSLTWDLTLAITVDDVAVTDLDGWGVACEVRRSPDSSVAVTPTVAVDGLVCSFALTAAQTATLNNRSYVWDVELTLPDDRVVTWPPAGEDRNTVTVTLDASRPVAEEEAP